MSQTVLQCIVRHSDIDTRILLGQVGLDVTPGRVKIPPDFVLPVWSLRGTTFSLRKGFIQLVWYPAFGYAYFFNWKSRYKVVMDVHDTMKVNTGLNVDYHPDYFAPCRCGCGYNTNRSHPRIRLRAVPSTFPKKNARPDDRWNFDRV
jgi:hypothetical protein